MVGWMEYRHDNCDTVWWLWCNSKSIQHVRRYWLTPIITSVHTFGWEGSHLKLRIYNLWPAQYWAMSGEDSWSLVLVVTSVTNLCLLILYWIILCGEKKTKEKISVYCLLTGLLLGKVIIMCQHQTRETFNPSYRGV